jgi:hypothetical protein
VNERAPRRFSTKYFINRGLSRKSSYSVAGFFGVGACPQKNAAHTDRKPHHIAKVLWRVMCDISLVQANHHRIENIFGDDMPTHPIK